MRIFQALGKNAFTTAPNTILNIDHINNANKQDKTIVQSIIFFSPVAIYDIQTYLHNQKNETQQYNNHHDTDFQAMQNVF